MRPKCRFAKSTPDRRLVPTLWPAASAPSASARTTPSSRQTCPRRHSIVGSRTPSWSRFWRWNHFGRNLRIKRNLVNFKFASMAWDRCYDFLNISPKNFAIKLAFLTQNKAKFWKKSWSEHWYLRKTPIFRRKLGKIAENCDHNIDPL
jgi:hypothetical protein